MLKIGDLVRTKDVVGILDGDTRGPGHHVHYLVRELHTKNGVTVESGSGTLTYWEDSQLEGSTLGFYMQELIKEANHHLGWEVVRVSEILKGLHPEHLVNLTILDQLRDVIHNNVQKKFDDQKYEEVAQGLFEKPIVFTLEAAEKEAEAAPVVADMFDASPDAVEAAAQAFGYPPADPVPPAVDEITAQFTPEEIAADVDPWAALAGTPTVDATAGISLEDLQVIQENFERFDGEAQLMTPEMQEQFISIFTPSMQQFLNEGYQTGIEALARASESVETAQAAVDKCSATIDAKLDEERNKPGRRTEPRTVDFDKFEQIPLSELASIKGTSLQYLTNLIRRKVLPEGEKKGRTRYMPARECLDILANDPGPGKPWPKLEQPQAVSAISWDDLR